MEGNIDKKNLETGIKIAADWLTDIAQLKTETLPGNTEDTRMYGYKSWKGAFRGEYEVAKKKWWFFCPVWHTGQAVKALIMAYKFFGSQKYLKAAKEGASFVLDKQVWNKSAVDHGLILAFEDFADKVNTSAVLESMHGLIMLANEEKSAELWKRIITAGEFLIRHLYMPEKGLYRDLYDPVMHSPIHHCGSPNGRPLLDDSIMLHLYNKTGDKKFLDVQIKISETLVATQNPPGNWINYVPCDPRQGSFHPRHTYWWGLPLLDTYSATGREEFLQTAIASGKFCEKAIRKDGGYFRGYYLDGKTDSFGHATSGSACAAILFSELYRQTKEFGWSELSKKALNFCLKVQFTTPNDRNLKGAILEKVLPPDGTDCSPYYIRDLGTIFFIISGLKYLGINHQESL